MQVTLHKNAKNIRKRYKMTYDRWKLQFRLQDSLQGRVPTVKQLPFTKRPSATTVSNRRRTTLKHDVFASLAL